MKGTQQPPLIGARIPREKLGLPGASYQLHTRRHRKGEAPDPPACALQDNYRVVLTLSRTMPDVQVLSFESGITGDSYIQIARPEKERTPAGL